MKKTLIFAASALLLAACDGNKDLAPEQITGETNLVEYSFKVGAETKAAISDDGTFSWAEGDEIAVWDAQNNKFDKFTADAAGASTTITGMGAADANYTTAYYPYAVASDAAGENSIVWPASYESAAAAAKGFPMMAVNNEGSLAFKHLGALLKVSIKDLPAGVTALAFNANVGVSGTLAVDATNPDEPFCAPGSSASSITLPTAGTAGDAVFYLPLPAGTLTDGFSIDFKITSANNKVVGSKATTSSIAIPRAKVVPMKEFTPTFNWPKNSDAFDYGVANGSSKKASYPSKTEREAVGVVNNQNVPSTEPYAVLNGVTYYPALKFSGDRMETGSKPGPEVWLNTDEYGKVIPQNRCFSWKVNRPGKFSYPCVVYSNKSARPVSYKLAILKTVDGVTSASAIIDFTPDVESVHERSTEGGTPKSECYQEFEVTEEDLLGIDDAATLYFYGYTKGKTNQIFYHYPFTWFPAVAE